jgi:hypothetical protein
MKILSLNFLLCIVGKITSPFLFRYDKVVGFEEDGLCDCVAILR